MDFESREHPGLDNETTTFLSMTGARLAGSIGVSGSTVSFSISTETGFFAFRFKAVWGLANLLAEWDRCIPPLDAVIRLYAEAGLFFCAEASERVALEGENSLKMCGLTDWVWFVGELLLWGDILFALLDG